MSTAHNEVDLRTKVNYIVLTDRRNIGGVEVINERVFQPHLCFLMQPLSRAHLGNDHYEDP